MATTATNAVTAEAASKTAKKKKINWQSLPEIWALIHPRRGCCCSGCCWWRSIAWRDLVLPGSSKYLFDNVIDKHQVQLLVPIVLAVVGATLLQGSHRLR